MDVLITHYEQQQTLLDAIESLASQLSDEDTIHIVDAGSTDGSFHELEKLDYDDRIELLYRDGVSRGRGRQIAFEESEDEIVVAHADLDTVFYPVLDDLAREYRRIRSEQGPGLLLVHGCFVSDRATIESVGGWNDLQAHEDKDLWVRAEEHVSLYRMPVSVVRQHDNFEWDSPIYRLKRLYQNYRDAIRLGVPSGALRESDRAHRPVRSWPVGAALVAAADRGAERMESYGTIAGSYPDPTEFHLRELTFRSLVESGLIEPTAVPRPDHLSSYQSEQTYPGKTSYL